MSVCVCMCVCVCVCVCTFSLTWYADEFLQLPDVGLGVGWEVGEGGGVGYAGLPARQGDVVHLHLHQLRLLRWEEGGREGGGGQTV